MGRRRAGPPDLSIYIYRRRIVWTDRLLQIYRERQLLSWSASAGQMVQWRDAGQTHGAVGVESSRSLSVQNQHIDFLITTKQSIF
jgi:hypothetical protein